MSDDQMLSKIYAYLELDTVIDQRLKLKAGLMKKVIFLMMQWKEGSEHEWIDKLANRCSLSTRKIRENYVEPLVTDGILEWTGNGRIRFVGIPENAVMPCELTEQQLQEELEEENENRAKLGQHKLTLKEWKKKRSLRIKPLE
ncbi:hypothetical protein MUP77_14370 [Candidatus Bathyarchaeota archaeon]|nr:hypothetical protein [Candidatus Bathyarchaeota archaeon]